MYIFFILVPPMFGDILAPSISLHTKREKPLMFRTFCSPLNFEKLYRTMSWSQVWLSIPFSKRNLDFSLIKIARKSRIRDVNSGIWKLDLIKSVERKDRNTFSESKSPDHIYNILGLHLTQRNYSKFSPICFTVKNTDMNSFMYPLQWRRANREGAGGFKEFRGNWHWHFCLDNSLDLRSF